MVKTPFVDENGLKKGAWSAEEDDKLRSYIQRYGHWNWREIPKFAGLARCGKSCRLRWTNYLRPNVKHGNYTKEEEDLIIKLHGQIGNRWSKIAASLPGRTDNEIKNYWHTHLKKRVQDQTSTTCKLRKRNFTKKSPSHKFEIIDNNNHNGSTLNLSEIQILESYTLSQLSANNSESTSSNSETIATTSNTDHNRNDSAPSQGSNALCLSTMDAMGELLLDETFWTEPFVLETFELNGESVDLCFSDKGSLLSPSVSYWESMYISCLFSSDVTLDVDG